MKESTFREERSKIGNFSSNLIFAKQEVLEGVGKKNVRYPGIVLEDLKIGPTVVGESRKELSDKEQKFLRKGFEVIIIFSRVLQYEFAINPQVVGGSRGKRSDKANIPSKMVSSREKK